MPRRPSRSRPIVPVTRPSTVVVVDSSFASALGLPRITADYFAVGGVNTYLQTQLSVLDRLPPWVNAFRDWVMQRQPTLISFSPDTVLDSTLFQDCIAPQSYGYGTPPHVPALFKPNGSLNWFQFADQTFPRSIRGFYPLRRDGLACHSGCASSLMPNYRDTSPALEVSTPNNNLFVELRSEARRRLEAAADVLLLGLEAWTLSASDLELLRSLAPTRRMTLVSSSSSNATALRIACNWTGACDVELANLDTWVLKRLTPWSSSEAAINCTGQPASRISRYSTG